MRYNRAPHRRPGRGQLTTTDETASVSYALEPVELDIRMRTSRSETSSKPFLGTLEDVDSVSFGKTLPQTQEAVNVVV